MKTYNRKIIQLVSGPTPLGHDLYALCDDGTVWKLEMIGALHEPPAERFQWLALGNLDMKLP